MLDVGEDELLVLLLVLQAEGDERRDLGVATTRVDQHLHAHVDVGAVTLHVGQRRPADEPALRPRIAIADALVVAVEENAIGRIEGPEVRLEALEDERLEEPA